MINKKEKLQVCQKIKNLYLILLVQKIRNQHLDLQYIYSKS